MAKIKTYKDEFINRIERELKYPFYKIHEFADEHLQNLNTLDQNIKDFKEWIGKEDTLFESDICGDCVYYPDCQEKDKFDCEYSMGIEEMEEKLRNWFTKNRNNK